MTHPQILSRTAFSLLFICSILFANAQVLIETPKIDTLLALEQYAEALQLQKELVGTDKTNAKDQFLLAELYALNNNKKKALHHLNLAYKHGYRDVGSVWDKDLDFVKGTREHKEFAAKIKEDFITANPGINHALAFEILEMLEYEQWTRHQSWICDGICSDERIANINQQTNKIDARNLDFLNTYLTDHAFPSKDLVGVKAADAFATIFVHTPFEFKEQHYLSFRKAAMNGDVSKQSLALATDKILNARIGMTLYGTQMDKQEDGTYQPVPVLHKESVEQRRAKLGLRMSLKDYYSVWEFDFDKWMKEE